MPWLAVEQKYEFDGPKGKASLLDLFDGRRQLIVYPRLFSSPACFGLARACLPRLLLWWPTRFARLAHLERSRHHPRLRLACAAS